MGIGRKCARETRGCVRRWSEGKSGGAVTESRARTGKKRTPRLRAPVGTPGETGVGRPDGRKPEAGEGAGPGSGGVTGNPVARMRDGDERLVSEAWCWVVNGVSMTYMGPG